MDFVVGDKYWIGDVDKRTGRTFALGSFSFGIMDMANGLKR